MITLKTLPQATEQEVFDQVAEHLLTQNKKSMDIEMDKLKCKYRSSSGLQCAGGCLIGDDEYKPAFDLHGQWSALLYYKLVPREHGNLIQSLQTIHDTYEPEEWRRELIIFGSKYDLNVDKL